MKAKYIYQIGAFLLGSLILSGCVEWPEFEALDLESAPTVTVEQTNVGDSTITVDVTSSANGFVSAILLPGTGNPIPADSGAILQGNVEYLDYASGETEANTPVSFTFETDIVQNTPYEVMAVAANADGVVSTVEVISITTDDTYSPNLLATYPAITYDPVIELADTIMLEFDEPVALGAGKFTFEAFYEGQVVEVPAANLFVSGNMVGIILPFTPAHGDYLWLHWEDGAVEDLSGNGVPAVTTIMDGGAFVGYYWRIVKTDMDFKTVTPDLAEDQLPGFDITFTYDSTVSFVTSQGDPVIEDGDITLAYNDGDGSIMTIDVPVTDVTIDGVNLTIAQSNAPPWFGQVTIDIPEGIFSVGHGNPMVAVSETWIIAHPLGTWIGTYTVAAASYGDPGNWDEEWTVTTSFVPGEDDKLSILGIGDGGTSPVIATIDMVNLTITIDQGQDSDAYASYGYTESLVYYGNTDLTIDDTQPLVGTITEDGGIVIDNFGIYVQYEPDPTENVTWDVFNTTWTKGGKKGAFSGNSVDKARINKK